MAEATVYEPVRSSAESSRSSLSEHTLASFDDFSNEVDDGEYLTARSFDDEAGSAPADGFDDGGKGKLGITSAVFLILNKMIGTGIFSTPSGVLLNCGSAGASVLMWLAGGVLSMTGMSVFLEFGLAIPKSGGEKNYLERVYRRPRLLITCVFFSQMILLGFSASNCLAFGRYVLFAAGADEPSETIARAVAVSCISVVVLVQSLRPNLGTRLFNVLGMFKVVVLAFIVCTGMAAVLGLVPHDGDVNSWSDVFADSGFASDGFAASGTSVGYATALMRVVYSYRGWENANYVVSELRDPRRTLAVAAPLAIVGVTVLYVLANVAYLAVIPRQEIARSGVIVAGLFFRRVFGASAGARVLPFLVALSNLGNVLVVSYAHARVNHEFASEGLLPRQWANWKLVASDVNVPVMGLGLHWLITVIVLTAPPSGEAYEFIIDLNTYPAAWMNMLVASGLVYLQHRKAEHWRSPFRSLLPVTVTYIASNVFLMVTPLVMNGGTSGNAAVTAAAGMSCLGMGVVYWAIWSRLLPWIGSYDIVAARTDTGGVRYVKVKRGQEGSIEA
ncbi:amino acid permease-domain-containing protein [Lipomyces japonicus]|uniref:amino acid permease-domain-containing protein n=1 Tax=Lipomyces japonicus TaxID=56871 RepID=UPI0034CF0A11